MFSKSFFITALGGAILFFASAQANAQAVCLYEHANFQGNAICLQVGQNVDNLATGGLNDRISSISIRNNVMVTVCEHANYKGICRTYGSDVHDLSQQGFNDRISSIRVQAGGWQPPPPQPPPQPWPQPTPNPWNPPPQPTPNPWNPPQPPPYQSYALQNFANYEQQAINWNQKYNAAPYGSWESNYASQQREQAIQSAINAISGYNLQGVGTAQVEAFADQLNQKYNAASYGSAMSNFYQQARQLAYQAFNNSLQKDVQSLQYGDWHQLHNIALDLDQKYNAASYGSAKSTAYNQARQTAWGALPNSVAREAQQTAYFTGIETTALYFDGLYNAASYGSLKSTTYNQIRTESFQAAVNRFQQTIYQYSQQSLFQIQADYHSKYNSASYGSAKSNYFMQIRDAARKQLGM